MDLLCVSGRRVFHLRTTILPAEEDFPAIMSSFKNFNDSFMAQYEGYSRMWRGNHIRCEGRIGCQILRFSQPPQRDPWSICKDTINRKWISCNSLKETIAAFDVYRGIKAVQELLNNSPLLNALEDVCCCWTIMPFSYHVLFRTRTCTLICSEMGLSNFFQVLFGIWSSVLLLSRGGGQGQQMGILFEVRTFLWTELAYKFLDKLCRWMLAEHQWGIADGRVTLALHGEYSSVRQSEHAGRKKIGVHLWLATWPMQSFCSPVPAAPQVNCHCLWNHCTDHCHSGSDPLANFKIWKKNSLHFILHLPRCFFFCERSASRLTGMSPPAGSLKSQESAGQTETMCWCWAHSS